jgi:hypothetical protein
VTSYRWFIPGTLLFATVASCVADPETGAQPAEPRGGGVPDTIMVIDGGVTPELAGIPRSVTTTAEGEAVVLPNLGLEPVVFGSDGRPRSVLVRAGDGPGELPVVWTLAMGRDGVLSVFGLRKVLSFSPELALLREYRLTDRLPALQFAEPLADGRWLLGFQQQVGPGRFIFVHELRDTAFVRERELESPRGPDGPLTMAVAGSRNARQVWSLHVNPAGVGMILSRLDIDGGLLNAVEVQPAKWKAVINVDGFPFPAEAAVIGLAEHERDDTIIIAWRLPRDDVPLSSESGLLEMYESVVASVDWPTGIIREEVRVPGYIVRVWRDGQMAVYQENDGEPRLTILRTPLGYR